MRVLLFFLGSILGVALGALAPWFGPFFDFRLISDYWQPQLNTVCSEVAVIAFFVAYVLWRRNSQKTKRALMTYFLCAAAFCFFVCLAFAWTVGVTWEPGITLTYIIRGLWILIYLALFAFLAMGLCCLVMLLPKEDLTKPASE